MADNTHSGEQGGVSTPLSPMQEDLINEPDFCEICAGQVHEIYYLDDMVVCLGCYSGAN